jgi:hypothetical protein
MDAAIHGVLNNNFLIYQPWLSYGQTQIHNHSRVNWENLAS